MINPNAGQVTLVVELSPNELAAIIKYVRELRVMDIKIDDIVDLRKGLLSMNETWKEYMEL